MNDFDIEIVDHNHTTGCLHTQVEFGSAVEFQGVGSGSGFTQAGVQVAGGTLGVNSTLNAATATVAAGAVLRGTGTIGGALTVAGTLFPGDVSSTLTNAPKGTLTANSADFSVNGGTLRSRVWLKDATHAEADNLTLATPAANALKLDGTSKLDLRVQTPGGVVVVNNLDVEIVHGGDAANNTYSAGFGSLTLSYGASVSNMSVLYVNKSFVPNTGDTVNVVATQVANQPPTPPLGANSFNRIFVRFNNSVTPITVESFAAKRDGAGVLIEWALVSEYRNAGLNRWRRDLNEAENAWAKVNATLVPGRIPNPDAKTYRFYDWAGAGDCEYRLESVDIAGVRAYQSRVVKISAIDGVPLSQITPQAVEAALDAGSAERTTARGSYLTRRLAEAQRIRASALIDGASPALTAKITRISQ